MKIVRTCIYPKDIQIITGRSERFGRKMINDIKKHYGKSKHQFVTVVEFSEYSGIDEEIVTSYLQKVS